MTSNPTAEWTARQLLEAFPRDNAPRYLLRDRDRVYGDVEWRKEGAEKIGLGFKLTSLELRIGQPGQLSKSKTQPARAA